MNTVETRELIADSVADAPVLVLNAETAPMGLALAPYFADQANALDQEGFPAEDASNWYGAVELLKDGETLLAVPVGETPPEDGELIRAHFVEGLSEIDAEMLADAAVRLNDTSTDGNRPRPR